MLQILIALLQQLLAAALHIGAIVDAAPVDPLQQRYSGHPIIAGYQRFPKGEGAEGTEVMPLFVKQGIGGLILCCHIQNGGVFFSGVGLPRLLQQAWVRGEDGFLL